MLRTIRAIIRHGRVDLLEQADVPDGTQALVTLLPEDEEGIGSSTFWLEATASSLKAIWDNPEDDVYADLLDE